MNTWTHALINTAIARAKTSRGGEQPSDPDRMISRTATRAALFGAIAPDVPLFLLTLWYWTRYDFGFGPEYDRLFFNDPLWIVGHNVFHAPFVSLCLIGAAVLVHRSVSGDAARRIAVAVKWFGISTLLHTAIDVPTHYHDGPLILFPFNWSFRVQAPVSYWDPARGDVPMAIFELALGIVLLVVWVRWWRRGRKTRRALEAG